MNSQNSELKMLESICKELGVPNLLEVLSTTPMRRLQPVLIHAFKNRAEHKTPADILREYEDKLEFFGVGTIPQDDLYNFALTCHEAVGEEFEIVQTSPIAPFGLNAVLSKVSQNNSLSSIRGSEVVSDITSQLALECSRRRKKALCGGNIVEKQNTMNLCSSGRVLRLQPFDKTKGYMQHFNLFALCSAGINSKSNGGFAIPMLKVHISTLLKVLSALNTPNSEYGDITVKISDMRFLDQLIGSQENLRKIILRNSLNDSFDIFDEYKIKFPREISDAKKLNSDMFSCVGIKDHTKYFEHLEEGITNPLRVLYPDTNFCFDFARKSGLGYYPHLCFHIFAKNHRGDIIQIADGGSVDWSSKLLGNMRESMVTSGIGSELMQKLF